MKNLNRAKEIILNELSGSYWYKDGNFIKAINVEFINNFPIRYYIILADGSKIIDYQAKVWTDRIYSKSYKEYLNCII